MAKNLKKLKFIELKRNCISFKCPNLFHTFLTNFPSSFSVATDLFNLLDLKHQSKPFFIKTWQQNSETNIKMIEINEMS